MMPKKKFLTRTIVILFLLLISTLGIIAFLFVKNGSDKKNLNDNNNDNFNPSLYFNHYYSDNEKTELFNRLKEIINHPNYLTIDKVPSSGLGRFLELNVIERKIKENSFIVEIGDRNEFSETYQKYFRPFVGYCDLKPAQWEEIVKLIKTKNQQKTKIYEEISARFENKIEQEGVYYWVDYWKNDRTKCFNFNSEKRQYYLTFRGRKNGFPVWLKVAKNHPILNNFSFQTGVFQIETQVPLIKKSQYYEYFIEPENQITIKNLLDFSY